MTTATWTCSPRRRTTTPSPGTRATAADPPTFTQHVITTNADGASSVFAVDLNHDGFLDVISASENDDTIAWYESNGADPPIFIERVIVTSARRALSVHARDLDGDGDVDILSASFNDSKIAAYLSDLLDDPARSRLHPRRSQSSLISTTVFHGRSLGPHRPRGR